MTMINATYLWTIIIIIIDILLYEINSQERIWCPVLYVIRTNGP